MKEICKELGFVSENAQMYAKKGSDHHKLWDILEACYIAFTDELLLPYVRSCQTKNIEPTVENYWDEFCLVVRNPNYIFVQQMVFTFLHALMILRKGMRMNKQEYIYAGKNKLSLLFFGRNHPHYHQLISYEKRIEVLMPHEVRVIKFTSLVLSRTGRVGRYQSGDAVIEEVNKEAKRDLVGVPNESQWRRSFRNLDAMNKIRSQAFKDAGVTDPKTTNYNAKVNIEKEVRKIRVLIRQHKYLENAAEIHRHTDITKSTPLGIDLVNFTAIAKRNIMECLPKILNEEPYKVRVVFSTLAEQKESEKNRKLYCCRDQTKNTGIIGQFF